jgi:endonuclease/exonuclease/phosphatase (EEP) superfamily protein YafD
LVCISVAWPLLIPAQRIQAETETTLGQVHTFSVMQVNVNFENHDPATLRTLIQQHMPTVVSLNEIEPAFLKVLRIGLEDVYPYLVDYAADGYLGMAVMSQVPFASTEGLSIENKSAPLIKTTFVSLPITLVSVHTLSPVSAAWSKARDTYLGSVAPLVRDMHDPVIVLGDFNQSMYAPAFKEFLHDATLTDADVGFGWKPTWSVGLPWAAAIDHILYRGQTIVPANYQVVSDINSDHRPLLATFTIHSPSL